MYGKIKNKKVFVAMSGGVDSSVTAALLQKEGYMITGVFIKGWYPDWLPCSWREERHDAMRVCADLSIPFHTIDLSQEYKKDVVDYMISEYKNGRTPNPDVMCNKHIKFGAFLKKETKRGAEMIATGHHARITQDVKSGTYKLLTGVDSAKDQSYFLWTLTQNILKKTLFPVGNYTKSEVRNIATKYNLHNANKKDSQGICFLGHIDIAEFLKHYIDVEEGKILNKNGDSIGTHEGALIYTIGQRHGFEVTKKSPDSEPFYVVAKDLTKNTITVSENFKEKEVFEAVEIILEEVNWIAEPIIESQYYKCRFRYRQPLQKCTLSHANTKNPHVIFSEGQKAIAIGQSFVLYKNEECLGGGVIKEVI